MANQIGIMRGLSWLPTLTDWSFCNFRDAQRVDEAVGHEEVAVACHVCVADNVAAARNCPGLKLSGFGIEAHNGVRLGPGFAVPHDIADCGDAVRLRLLA